MFKGGKKIILWTLALGLCLTACKSAEREDGLTNEKETEIDMQSEKTPLAPPIHGWDIYRKLDQIALLNAGVETKQFSSFDRTGGNEKDGFDGTYSYLRKDDTGFVIVEAKGAGEVQSIWFTRDGGNVSRTGHIRIELDGAVVLDAPLQDVVDGKEGEPFVFPFVANAKESSGGVTIKVPMPYKESMKISTTQNPNFYHVSYRTFASAEGIDTFDPKDIPQDVLEASKTWGEKDPKIAQNVPVKTLEGDLSLAPGEETLLAEYEGTGQLRSMQFTINNLVGAPPAEVVIDDGRAHVGISSFKAKIDAANEGVILVRRYDSISTNQTANIYIDDQMAAQWTGQDIVAGGWVEEEVAIAASYTRGKEEIQIRNEFVSAGMDFSEFHFFIYSIVNGEKVLTDTLDVGPFVASKESEKAHGYSVTGQNWEGDRTYILPHETENEEAILRTDALLEGLTIQVKADGQVLVDSPFGSFFGSALGLYDVRALFYQMDQDGTFTSWWPMPFKDKISVSLINTSEQTLEGGTFLLEIEEDESIKTLLENEFPGMGYFHAEYRQSDTKLGRDWIALDTEAYGKFVGINHTMDSLQDYGNTRGYLEGDERFYLDGLRSPIWHGTGTEDFYEGGWYFNQGTFSNPMNGAPATEAAGMYGTRVQSDSNYRLLIGDAIDFHKSLSAGFEPGPQQDHPAHYQATAFYYGHKNVSSLEESDLLDVTNSESAKSHQLQVNGEEKKMLSTFEGRNDKIGVNRSHVETTEPISFTMKINPDNFGVRLSRVADQNKSYQEVEVYIDDVHVGNWLQVLGNQTHRWLEDSFDISPEFTMKKNQLNIKLVPVEDSSPWSQSEYKAYSVVRAKANS